MLKLQGIRKDYDDFTAVTSIDLELEEGVYGFLSPNGAGKTTLLKMVATLILPTDGEITWKDRDIFTMGEDYRELLGYMPQKFGYYRDYTAEKFLLYLAVLKGMDRQKAKVRIDELLSQVGLSEVKKQKLKTYSGGMLQRVGIAQAMLNEPQILILDEPTAGLDPGERARFREMLAEFSKGRIVLYSTHIVSDVENLANRIIMLKDHQLFANATPRELCDSMEGKVFSTHVREDEYDEFANAYFILSVRQERESKEVRFVAEGVTEAEAESKGWKGVYPNLEDVFLYVYQR